MSDSQFHLFGTFDAAEWPDPRAFPMNEERPVVRDLIEEDISASGPLQRIVDQVEFVRPFHQRITASILGIPGDALDET